MAPFATSLLFVVRITSIVTNQTKYYIYANPIYVALCTFRYIDNMYSIVVHLFHPLATARINVTVKLSSYTLSRAKAKSEIRFYIKPYQNYVINIRNVRNIEWYRKEEKCR